MHVVRFVSLLLLALLVEALPGLAAGRVLPGPTGEARAAAAAAEIRQLEAKARREGTVRVIVGLKVPFAPEATLAAREARLQVAEIAGAATGLQLRYAGAVARAPGSFRAYASLPFAALEVTPAELRALAADPEVVSIEENLLLRPSLSQSTALVRAPEAWAAGATGKGQVIAIVDTGVASTHPMLAGKVVSEACYSTGRLCPGRATSATGAGSGGPCSSLIQGCWHGTHVAGIAAGRSVNGLSGVAPEAQIIAIQVASTTASGVGIFLGDMVAALDRVHALRSSYAIAAVNLSLGFPQLYPQNCNAASRVTTKAIEQLRAAGIATVAASGNDGSSKGIAFPACVSAAVSVGSVSDADWGTCTSGNKQATTAADRVACYSNASRVLSLLAPGSLISSAVPGNGYSSAHGTSMAAPHVAGAFAVLRSKAPDARPADLLATLRSTGRRIADYRDSGIVTPRIDVKAALDAVGGDGKFGLSLSMAGNGRGKVAFAPAGGQALCAASCVNRYAAGTAVTLTATADAPSIFAGWSGACTGTGSCTVTLDAAKSVAARFDAVPSGPPRTLSLDLTGTGAPGVTLAANGTTSTCTSDCSPAYPQGSVVTVTASPSPGTAFVAWSGACTGRKPACVIRMNAPQTLRASFRKLPVVKLGINLDGYGSVRAAGGGNVTVCDGDCAIDVVSGTALSLTAEPLPGVGFSGWSGACRGPKARCDLTVSGPAALTARFD